MDSESVIHTQVGAAHLSVMDSILRHDGVSQAVAQARGAGIPFLQIIMAILPFVAQILGGGKVDWQAIIAAVLALITPK